jgi:hypothetical protein
MSHKYVEGCRTEYTATSNKVGLYPDVLLMAGKDTDCITHLGRPDGQSDE